MGLIGRDAQLDELDERLRSHRLVTVVGPGGIGKTTLALAAGGRCADRFPGGIDLVDLTRVAADDAVPGAVAGQLGLGSFDGVLATGSAHRRLVVLDSCEHVIDGAASVARRLVGPADGVTVLATSRSPLELPGEVIVALAPLAVPSAVQLFLERALEAGAPIGDVDVDDVASLCRRLDGLPLAIEIAAARARSMAIPDIVAHLDAGVDVLDRPRFRGPQRHRSVAETIGWSFELLDERGQATLPRLAVFDGPFTLAAAHRVAGGDLDPVAMSEVVRELVDASLVVVDRSVAPTRYRLLDSVRRFGLDRLDSVGALAATHDRFVDHVIDTAARSLAGAAQVWRPDLLRELGDQYDDLAAALRWCNGHDDGPRRALLLCSMLWALVHQGRADDIAVLARETLARWPERDRRVAAEAMATWATAEYVTGQPGQALAIAESALPTVVAPSIAAVTLRRVMGQARRALGDAAGAIDVLTDGARIGRELGMSAMAIELDVATAQVLCDEGRIDEALALVTAARAEAHGLGSVVSEVWAAATEGWIRFRRGDPDALATVEAALEHARDIDYPIAIVASLRAAAVVRLAADDVERARRHVDDLLHEIVDRGAIVNTRMLVDAAAALADHVGHASAERLAVTAAALPVVSLMASTGSETVRVASSALEPLGAVAAIGLVRELLADLAAGAPSGEVPITTAPSARPSLRARGDDWEISFEGRMVHVRASKGMADLATLLAQEGREVHCLDLMGAAVDESSTGDVIDAEARRRYEQRVRDLQAEIDEADDAADLARAERARAEMDAIVDQLVAALGHGGRTRRAADSAERARSAVTQRVRSTVRRLAELDPALGRHLSVSVRTGIWCSYQPERPMGWDVR
ncbi:MAG: hypothetical protein MUE78_03875 [Ilumatobacteraceae bacterium]|nr:hypothetical protein [Ilumatobacteraceae bacterium]